MLTITTNKEKVQGIADRTLKEYPLPITDFWTKRIVKLLNAGDERTIIDSLTDERGTASSLEREVTFTAGGAASATATVTIKIAVLEQEKLSGGTEGVEHFILTIRDVTEVRGVTNGKVEDPEEDQPEVVGMPNAPAIRIMKSQAGFCKYCNQLRMIEAPEGASPADLNEQASEECDCDEARRQQERKMKMAAAGAWAENVFSKENGQLQTVLCAIRSTFAGAIDYVTIKVGKHTHKIDTDSDGMIRIRTTYRDSNEETF